MEIARSLNSAICARRPIFGAIAVLVTLAQLTEPPVRSDEKTAGLPNGWKRSETIPAIEQRGVVTIRESVLKAWVEMGWLVVRRETADGEIEWQVTLALASDSSEPEITIAPELGSLQVRYRDYFIREAPPLDTNGAPPRSPLPLRVYRERKTADSPEWPVLALPESRLRSRGFGLRSSEIDSWIWVEATPRARPSDVWIRLQHNRIRDPVRALPPLAAGADAERPGERPRLPDGGVSATLDGRVGGMPFGTRSVQDEGDLLLASRASFDTVNRLLRKRSLAEEFGGGDAPALTTGLWLHDVNRVALDELKGKVVLLSFWSARSGTSVTQSTRVEALHKKFRPAGLVVIGIHSADDADAADRVIKDKGLTFPVMMDTRKLDLDARPGRLAATETAPVVGETAERYATDFFPNYFLIDKSGKLSWGFSLDPPTEAQIEGLSK